MHKIKCKTEQLGWNGGVLGQTMREGNESLTLQQGYQGFSLRKGDGRGEWCIF